MAVRLSLATLHLVPSPLFLSRLYESHLPIGRKTLGHAHGGRVSAIHVHVDCPIRKEAELGRKKHDAPQDVNGLSSQKQRISGPRSKIVYDLRIGEERQDGFFFSSLTCRYNADRGE